MDYLNGNLGWVGKIFPDIYLAYSVKDVMDSLDKVRTPSKWTLKNTMSGIGYPGEILIALPRVNLKPDSERNYRVYDRSAEMGVHILESDLHPDSVAFSEITQGSYSLVYLLHQPHGDLTRLYGALREPYRITSSKKGAMVTIGTRLIPLLAPG